MRFLGWTIYSPCWSTYQAKFGDESSREEERIREECLRMATTDHDAQSALSRASAYYCFIKRSVWTTDPDLTAEKDGIKVSADKFVSACMLDITEREWLECSYRAWRKRFVIAAWVAIALGFLLLASTIYIAAALKW